MRRNPFAVKLIASLVLAALLSGCTALTTASYYSGSLLSPPSVPPDQYHTLVRLAQANFILVRTNVVGESRGFALLGLITMVPPRQITAMSRLFARAEMQTGTAQTLSDIIVERTSTYWILFSIPRVSVRAEVVEFIPAKTPAEPAKKPEDPDPPPEPDQTEP